MVETPRDISFCGHALHQRDLFIVPDATRDERFLDNPLVTGEPRVCFYAGAPLIGPQDAALGALCVIDHVPRTLNLGQQQAMRVLARQVMTHLELRRHMRELVESEERLQIVTENAHVGLVIVDRDRRYVYANGAYAEILDLPSAAIIGLRVPDVLPSIYEEQIRPRLDRAFAGESVTYELRKAAEGGNRHFAVRYEPTKVDGVVTLVVVVITDITEPRQAEIASHRLAAIVEFSDDAIIGKDLNGTITSWNRGAEKVFGYSAGEMVGASIMRLIPDDRQDEETQILAKIKRGESLNHFETLRQTNDGRLIDVSVTASPIKDAAGDVIGMSKVLRDITGRRQAEAALKKSEERFRMSMEHAMDAFLLHDSTGRFLDVNRRACESLGYSREELLKLNVSDVTSLSAEEAKSIWNQLQAGSTLTVSDHHRRRDGSRFPVEIRLGTFDIDGQKLVLGLARDITERKHFEEQLLWKTAFFEAQVNSALDGILVVDTKGKMILQNQRMIDLWNFPHDIVAETDDRARLEWVTSRVKNSRQFAEKVAWLYAHPEEISRDEIELVDRRILDRYSAPVRGQDGQYYGRIWSFRDITERKRTEEAQRNERIFISAVVDTVGSLVVVLDRQARIVRFNRACEQLTGYSFDDIKGQNLLDLLLLPEEQASTKCEFESLRAGNFPNTYENYWVTRDGNPRRISWSNTALVDADGAVEFVIGTGVDITERNRAQELIAEQAALIDKARDAILVRDLEGKIQFWNNGAERIYGWPRQDAIGRNVGDLFYTDPKKFKEVNELAISQGEWSGELRHQTMGRGEITVEARWTLIRDSEGQPKSVLAINTDVTERKKIEAQFMRAQRMESIGTLAGGIAHDLNNILAPIMMSVEVLKSFSDDPQAQRILETLEVSAQRGADIVRQVLSFARGVEGQRIEVQPKHLLKDLGNIIKDTFPKDIRLEFSIPNDTWTILGDPTQVHQILLNLCVNARDAMPDGGSLTVGVENCLLDEHYATMHIHAKAGRYVIISVTDSGTGIPPAVLDKIFEPFFTTKDVNKGTGLGLSTVMAIVKSHGGFVNVYSEPGRGTTFKVHLPAQEASSEAQQESETAGLPRGNGETVLVIDDEASIRAITSQTLEAFGYRVLVAMDGAEAVAVYAQHKNEIAAVLTDMMMPVMDGPAAIHALRRINPAVKIVAASGLNASASVARVSTAGIKHFLTKPYTAESLLRVIRVILDEA
jgi:PAS domain S-box-containing protein